MPPISLAIAGLNSDRCQQDGFIASPAGMDIFSRLNSEISQSDKLYVNAISDTDEALLLKFQKKFDVKSLYTDHTDMLSTENPDLLIILAQKKEILPIVSQAIQKGVKGILLERPITADYDDSLKIVDLCRLSQVSLVTDFRKRLDPLYAHVKDHIDSNTYGNLLSIHGNVRTTTPPNGDFKEIISRYGGGGLMYDGSDMIDLIRFFAGEIASVNAAIRRSSNSYGAESDVSGLLHTHSGISCTLTLCSNANYNEFDLELCFTKGKIRVGRHVNEYYSISSPGNDEIEPELVSERAVQSASQHGNTEKGPLGDLLDSIESRTPPECSGLNAIRNMEVALSLYYSAFLDGNTVKLPLKAAGNPLVKMFQSGLI